MAPAAYTEPMLHRRSRVRSLPLLGLLVALVALGAGCALPQDEDEPFLAGLCDATLGFSQALAAADTPEAIRGTIEAYRDEVAALEPPEDLDEYQADLVAYLDAVAADPASAGEPPEPPDDAERRLDSTALGVEECGETGFFAS